MSTLTRWRRDVVRATPGGKVGVAVILAAAGVGGYLRYKQVKVGDTVLVPARVFDNPPGADPNLTLTAKVISITGDSAMVAPIIAGVQSPMSAPISPLSNIIQNLTPRLF